MFFVLAAASTQTPRIKANVADRVVAKMVDLGVVFAAAAIIPYPAGPLLGFLYSILGDGMHFGKFEAQSLGKKLMKLKVVSLTRGQVPVTYKESALRNAPVGVATFFAIIPVWGWIILGLIGIPLMLMEIYLMSSVEMGHRLGDLMGGTEIVEAISSEDRPDGGSSSAFEN